MKFGKGKPIAIAAEKGERLVRMSIRDHGIGISEADRDLIFQPFGRAVSILNYRGLGLGLYVSKRIIEAHGGRMAVVTWPDEGTEFAVELPIVPEAGPGESVSKSSTAV
jgi:signal transduction histidine kinase